MLLSRKDINRKNKCFFLNILMIKSEERIVISVNQVNRKYTIIPMKKKHDEYEDICLK